MDNYLKDNILLVNKNKLLVIKLGKKINNFIFDCRLNKTEINNILKNLNQNFDCTNIEEYNKKIYKIK